MTEPFMPTEIIKPVCLSQDFEDLWYEAENNGNLNWICFPESAERFRLIAQRLLDAAKPCFSAEEHEDDDEGICLLMMMLDCNPNELPACADEQYQALRRSLVRVGLIFENAAEK